jgi:hypothetical protein
MSIIVFYHDVHHDTKIERLKEPIECVFQLKLGAICLYIGWKVKQLFVTNLGEV